jgi:hypothetical protein
MRDTLFIGHANPQDNEFAIWLYSKLELEGYKVWCDLESLVGGERDFWDEIQSVLDTDTSKYLLVFSKSSFTKDGIKDEYEFARSIANKYDLKDFVIPVKIDDVAYDQRIGLNRYNIINFSDSWLAGLKKLWKKLDRDKVPKKTNKDISVSDWILNVYDSEKTSLVKRREKYYSSWWPIPKLPQSMYLFQYTHEYQAQEIIEEDRGFPVIKHGNYLVSFEPNIRDIDEPDSGFKVKPENSEIVRVKDILKGYESEEFPMLLDSQNLLKRLLKKAFKNLLYERGLRRKKMASGQCFYYPKKVLTKNQATVHYHNRKKTKNLIGKYHDKFWHFGLSTQVRLSPFVCYSLKSHILFSDDGYKIWEADAKLHNARRAKGKRWFNEHWRDQLMALIASLARGQKKVFIKLSKNFDLAMPLLTEQFYSNIDYHEPNTKDRLDILHEDEEELYEIGVASELPEEN